MHSIHEMFENIVWSAESCSLKTFVHSYTLPQLVKVEEGFCSEDDAETLSTGEILMLHSLNKLPVEDADCRQYFVPRNCQCQVEILPRICEDRYYTVKDVVEAWTYADFNFIRVVEVHSHFPTLRIRAGEILKLNKTVEHNRTKFLECVFNDKTEYLVKLPLDVRAVFEPLARKGSYPFQEVLDSFEFPVRVRFKSKCKTQDANNNPSRGSVLLKNIRRETKIIATSRDDDVNPVLMIPTDLDVYVFPARGAILGDKEYARFCKAIHDSTDLSKVDLFENGSRLCECFEDPAEEEIENNEVVDLLPSRTIQDTHDHAPPRPPRVQSLPRSKSPTASKTPKQTPLPSAKLNQSPNQSIQGEYLSTTSNESPSNSIDDQAPPRPPRVESLPHSSATGGDKDEDYHYCDEISFTDRSSNPAVTAERYSMDNDSERVPKRQIDKLGQNKSSERDLLPAVITKLLSTPSGHLHRKTNDAAVSPQRPHPTSPLSEASSSVSSSDAVFSSQVSSTQERPIPEQPILPTQYPVSSCLGHSQDYPAEDVYLEPVHAPSILSNPLPEFSVLSQDLKDLPVEGVVECLTNLHMEQYAELFQRELIDGQLLTELDLESLSHLGVRNPLHQKKILKFINGWRPNTSQ